MRTRSMLLTGLSTAVVLGGGILAAEHAGARNGRDVPFYAEYVAIKTVDVAPKGVGIGDRLIYTDRAFTSAKKNKKLGNGYGECVRLTGTSESTGVFHCTETVRLAGGDVLLGGVYDLAAKSHLWTITGGTGRYRGATGEISFRPLSATTLDGVFHFGR